MNLPLSTAPKGRRHADVRVESNGQARQRQLLLDLAQRADEGIFIHLPIWLLIGWSTGLVHTSPVFYALNAALFGSNLLSRLALRRRLRALVARHPARARAAYLVPLIGNALHWGLLAAAATGWQPLADARVALWFTTVAVAASGTMALSIMPSVRVLYPVSTLLPVTATMLFEPQDLNFFYPVGLIALFAYMVRASGAVQRDYRCAADLRAELEERARELELLSTIDSLTGIRNRHYFDHRLVTEWTTAARERQPLTVLMIDVDHFKFINDTHGHAFGDRCLRAIAHTLEATLRHPNDTLRATAVRNSRRCCPTPPGRPRSPWPSACASRSPPSPWCRAAPAWRWPAASASTPSCPSPARSRPRRSRPPTGRSTGPRRRAATGSSSRKQATAERPSGVAWVTGDASVSRQNPTLHEPHRRPA